MILVRMLTASQTTETSPSRAARTTLVAIVSISGKGERSVSDVCSPPAGFQGGISQQPPRLDSNACSCRSYTNVLHSAVLPIAMQLPAEVVLPYYSLAKDCWSTVLRSRRKPNCHHSCSCGCKPVEHITAISLSRLRRESRPTSFSGHIRTSYFSHD